MVQTKDNTAGVIPKNAEEAKYLCFLANRILANEGLFDAFGHVSLRNPENPGTFFQSRSCSPEFVTEEDIIEIDLDGNVVTETDMRPYGERFIHSEILKQRPDVKAVYHGHPPEVVALTAAGIPYIPVTHTGAIFYEEVPVYDAYDITNATLVCTPPEAQRVARCFGQGRACLMKNHGLIVAGEGVVEMVMGAVFFRDNCNALIQAYTLGGGKISRMSREMGLVALEKHIRHRGVLERTWNYWLKRAKKAMPDL